MEANKREVEDLTKEEYKLIMDYINKNMYKLSLEELIINIDKLLKHKR